MSSTRTLSVLELLHGDLVRSPCLLSTCASLSMCARDAGAMWFVNFSSLSRAQSC